MHTCLITSIAIDSSSSVGCVCRADKQSTLDVEDKMRLLMCYLATHPDKLDATKRLQWMKVGSMACLCLCWRVLKRVSAISCRGMGSRAHGFTLCNLCTLRAPQAAKASSRCCWPGSGACFCMQLAIASAESSLQQCPPSVTSSMTKPHSFVSVLRGPPATAAPCSDAAGGQAQRSGYGCHLQPGLPGCVHHQGG
jgi:hypothetical protein